MTTSQKTIRNKVGLLELAKQLGNVSQACRIMGYSRVSFYRFKELYDKGGVAALQEMTKRGGSRGAALLAPFHEAFPPVCPSWQTPLSITACLTNPEPTTQILAHIGDPTPPPLIHPVRGPPQTEFEMDLGGREKEEVAQLSLPDGINQSPPFDPAEAEIIPRDHFDQSRSA